MNHREFKKAFKIAESNEDLSTEAELRSVFVGYALRDFGPVTVTTRQVADLIRYQCRYFGGGWDNEMLEEIRESGRRRFMIAD